MWWCCGAAGNRAFGLGSQSNTKTPQSSVEWVVPVEVARNRTEGFPVKLYLKKKLIPSPASDFNVVTDLCSCADTVCRAKRSSKDIKGTKQERGLAVGCLYYR